MANPNVSLTVQDGALGFAAPNPDGVHVKLGVSSLGTPDTVYSFSRPEDVRATLGYGPLVEAAVDSLNVAGGPVYLVPVTSSVAGSSSAVTQSGGGPAMTLSGAPVDSFQGVVTITKGGAVGTAEFKYSLDGGDTHSASIVTAATYLMPNTGVTLNFPVGTYVVDETYSWTDTAPYFSTGDLNAAFTALLADPKDWLFAHVVGRGAAAADSASVVAAVQSQMVSAASTKYKYARAIVEVADDSDANLTTAFASTDADRVMAVAGFAEMVSGVSSRTYKRPAAWAVASRAALVAKKPRVGIATHLGRVRDGGLDNISSLLRDEEVTPALDPLRFTTLRTIPGKQGFYVTRPRTMAASGSDFGFWHDCLAIDKACRTTRETMIGYLNDSVRTTGAGKIQELDAKRIEGDLYAALRNALINTENIVEAFAVVDRDTVITSTNKILVDVRLRKRGYLEDIGVTIGFERPES